MPAVRCGPRNAAKTREDIAVRLCARSHPHSVDRPNHHSHRGMCACAKHVLCFKGIFASGCLWENETCTLREIIGWHITKPRQIFKRNGLIFPNEFNIITVKSRVEFWLVLFANYRNSNRFLIFLSCECG